MATVLRDFIPKLREIGRSHFVCILIELISIKATLKALIKPKHVFHLHDCHAVIMKSELPVIMHNSKFSRGINFYNANILQ